MFGPLTIFRADVDLALPASRKVRALLAYLSLAPRPVARAHLCELLWDVPNDPRGELRWCLSKLRGLLDEPDRRRIETRADTVRLDLADCFVDAIEIARAAPSIETLSLAQLRTLAALFTGDFLSGLEVAHSHAFSAWLIAQRRRFREVHAAVLEQLVHREPDEEVLRDVETWLELTPFDQHAHELLFHALAKRGRLQEGEEHVATTVRLFEAEGLDATALREAWRSAKLQGSPRADAVVSLSASTRGDEPGPLTAPRRASIAVMPFVDASAVTGGRGGTADALAHDVITRLAKLRSAFVIAQGTVFALHERHVAPDEAGRILNVDYVAGGSVRRQGDRLRVTVELTETRTARIVWAEIFNRTEGEALDVLDEIGDHIVASIAAEIETSERNRAILIPPNSLDAWDAHHRGLWHMYRFNAPDNEQAQRFFQMAVRLDPTFARAYAGLSFTHFQNAFQGWAPRESEIAHAYEAAAQSLMVDDRDPAAHLALGRALWLRGRYEQSVLELEQTIDLSPNFAIGHYTLAFVHSQAGDPNTAINSSDCSRRLSPYDPLLFGMLGARAMALVRLRRFDEAADWAVKAAARPNAHAHIQAIAALSLALAGRHHEGRAYLATLHRAVPRYRVDDFLTAMKFEPDGERLFRDAAKRLGMP
ncbi:MAG TPA: BTAD domain-containing putative transcriptional regulator [Candidatus Limnocylindria bacterium]|nr:BTAD domain-containing putative transcriptional regulator [Candidatus Limnocylindria bacterium]